MTPGSYIKRCVSSAAHVRVLRTETSHCIGNPYLSVSGTAFCVYTLSFLMFYIFVCIIEEWDVLVVSSSFFNGAVTTIRQLWKIEGLAGFITSYCHIFSARMFYPCPLFYILLCMSFAPIWIWFWSCMVSVNIKRVQQTLCRNKQLQFVLWVSARAAAARCIAASIQLFCRGTLMTQR